MMVQGNLYVISAPSGAGKSSLIQALLKTQSIKSTHLSISYTTRTMRPGEKHGQHYFFVPIVEFERMISENAFLEYARVFDNYYGTSYSSIQQILATSVDVFLEIDWQGAQQIRAKMPGTRSIFIFPPSKEELNRRLSNRCQDSKEIIALRMAQAVTEMTHFSEYDYLVINDDFNIALNDLKNIIQAERLHLKHQKLRYNTLISKLLSD